MHTENLGGGGAGLREAPFEIFWFYMDIAQIALDSLPPLSNGQMWKKNAPNQPGKPIHPPSPSVKRANVEKKRPKPSWQPLTPSGKRGENVPQTILASLYNPPSLQAMSI